MEEQTALINVKTSIYNIQLQLDTLHSLINELNGISDLPLIHAGVQDKIQTFYSRLSTYRNLLNKE